MIRRKKWCTIIAAGMLMTGGWTFPAPAAAETIITVGGTGSALGCMRLVAALYEKSHPGVTVRILPSLGSAGGIKAAIGGGIDLALSSRHLTESERRLAAVEVEYARTPLAFVTNGKISKKNITVGELERIYADPVPRWPDGSRIRLVLRPEKDIDTTLVRNLSPGMEQAMRAAQARPGIIMAISDQESTEAIMKTPGALGCAALSEIFSEKRPVNVLAFNGVKPEVKNIASGAYSLFKSQYLVTTPKTSPAARQFAEFVRSRPAGKILSASGNMLVTSKQGP